MEKVEDNYPLLNRFRFAWHFTLHIDQLESMGVYSNGIINAEKVYEMMSEYFDNGGERQLMEYLGVEEDE